MDNRINLSEVYRDEEVERKALEVIRSGMYILNNHCRSFEEKFAKFIGRKYGVISNSATSVMHLTMLALGFGPGDEVITTSLTAFPTVEPILHVGAKPVFVDIDDTFNLNADLVEEKITKNTKAILPVHLYGNPADLKKLVQIARKHKLLLLEDCCQAHGAEYQGKKTGLFGKAAFYSFYPSKNLTVLGDGGMLLTDDARLAQRVRMLRDHGRKNKYLHTLLGFNMRANEIQGAMGLVQLKHLNSFNNRRRKIALLYNKLLRGLPLELPQVREGDRPVCHMYVIKTSQRDALADYLSKRNIRTGIHYPIPCHLQPVFSKLYGRVKLAKTEAVCRRILSLPIHPRLDDEAVKYVADTVRNFFEHESIVN